MCLSSGCSCTGMLVPAVYKKGNPHTHLTTGSPLRNSPVSYLWDLGTAYTYYNSLSSGPQISHMMAAVCHWTMGDSLSVLVPRTTVFSFLNLANFTL